MKIHTMYYIVSTLPYLFTSKTVTQVDVLISNRKVHDHQIGIVKAQVLAINQEILELHQLAIVVKPLTGRGKG